MQIVSFLSLFLITCILMIIKLLAIRMFMSWDKGLCKLVDKYRRRAWATLHNNLPITIKLQGRNFLNPIRTPLKRRMIKVVIKKFSLRYLATLISYTSSQKKSAKQPHYQRQLSWQFYGKSCKYQRLGKWTSPYTMVQTLTAHLRHIHATQTPNIVIKTPKQRT